jgi:SpoVK/Ycf46/Vps4 family AAA+-type ATPase
MYKCISIYTYIWQDKIVVFLVASPAIPFRHVSLPAKTRSALGLHHFDVGRFTALQKAELRIVNPTKIVLQPIRWEHKDIDNEGKSMSTLAGKPKNVTFEGDSSGKKEAPASSINEMDVYRVVSSLSRLCDEHLSFKSPSTTRPVPIYDGQILALKHDAAFARRLFGNDKQDDKDSDRMKTFFDDTELVDVDYRVSLSGGRTKTAKFSQSPSFMLLDKEIMSDTESGATIKLGKCRSMARRALHDDENDDAGMYVRRLWGYEEKQASLLRAMMPMLLPHAVYERIAANSLPITSSIVSGDAGVGKSSMVAAIRGSLNKAAKCAAPSYVLDCATLRSRQVGAMMTAFTDIFSTARTSAPSVICIDNLDAVLPAFDAENVVGNEQNAGLLALHVKQLLRETVEDAQRSHRDARCMYEAYNDEQTSSSDSATDQYREEEIAFQAMQNVVFVVMTSGSYGNVHSIIRSSEFAQKCVELSDLSPRARIDVFIDYMHELGAVFDEAMDLETLGSPECLQLAAITEGARPGDIINFAKRVFSEATQRCVLETWMDATPTDPGIVIQQSDISHASVSFQVKSSFAQKNENESEYTWNDVGGLLEAKKVIEDTYRKPRIFHRIFSASPVKMPRSVLLYGPSGCGKTLVALATARECGLNLLRVRGPELLDKYIGASEKAVRELFRKARNSGQACLIFFDEFEALGAKRGRDNTGVTDRVVNQLLTLLDGVEASMGGAPSAAEDDDDGERACKEAPGGQVYIMAATSRPDLVDPALLRPGRIDKHVYVGLPSESERIDILEAGLRSVPSAAALYTLSQKPACSDSVFHKIARHANSKLMSPADLRSIVNTAHLLCVQDCMGAGGSPKEDGNEPEITSTLQTEDDFVTSAHSAQCALQIQPSHIWQAFVSTRPSFSQRDITSFDELYREFRDVGEPDAMRESANKLANTPLKTSLM